MLTDLTREERYIARCVELSRLGEYYVAPNPMVGAVLVDASGKIIAEGWHRHYGGPHAEVECFREWEIKNEKLKIKNYDLSECTLYVSLEPCSHYGKTPPCADMIIAKGVKRVVVGMEDPNPLVAGKGIARMREAGIEVTVGVGEAMCREVNKRFICLHEKHRPYVTLKWAQTRDGFLDRKRQGEESRGKGEESREKSEERHLNGALAISNTVTKQEVHKLRAENMAIMIGTRTALLDNPGLKTTHWPGRNPIRVLLDRKGVVPRESKIFSPDAETIVYSECTDWEYILNDLSHRGIHSLLVEGGAQLLQTILDSGIYDEVQIEYGDEALGTEGVKAPEINETKYEKNNTIFFGGHLFKLLQFIQA